MDGLSNSDVALLQDRGGMFGGDSGFFWVFALLLLAGGGFTGFGGYNRGDYVTQAELTAGLNNNAIQNQLQQITLSSANNNYETARLIQEQTGQLINQTNRLEQQIQALDAKMSSCCCEIKTQMLQYRLDDSERKNVVLENEKSNNLQTQNLLSQLGRFVLWAGSGAPATTAAAG